MPLLKWKPEYTVNEASLDSHHKRLFEILNKAYENVMNSLEVNCVIPVVDELSECIKDHFVAEEQFMKENEYHEIDAHIAEHRLFTHDISTLKTNFNSDNLESTKELIIVLGNWILHHILMEDRKYATFLHPGEQTRSEV